ncbi:hypothetical protein [Streptomyces sp.]|uniref:hypothetical protein n=1 Tax=Streptomyces sp. TaxID=1931 RepID=UPI002F3E2032
MPDPRYHLHDGKLLRRLMENPLPGGTSHTVRSLAAETGVSYSKIQKLISEQRPTVTASEADRISHAVQCRRKALFSPLPPPSSNEDDRMEASDGLR